MRMKKFLNLLPEAIKFCTAKICLDLTVDRTAFPFKRVSSVTMQYSDT